MSPTKSSENGNSILLTLLLVVIIAIMAKDYWREFRRVYFLKTTRLMLKPLALWSDDWGKLKNIAEYDLDLASAEYLAKKTGLALGVVTIPLQAIALIYIVLTHKKRVPQKKLNAWGMVETYAKVKPCLAPIVKTGPINLQSRLDGPWATFYNPIVFAIKNRLYLDDEGQVVKLEDVWDPRTSKPLEKEVWPQNPKINEELTKQVFVAQLGPPLSLKQEDLKDYYGGLAMAFWSQIQRDKSLCQRILDELALNWNKETRQTFSRGAHQVLAKFKPEDLPKDLKRHLSFRNSFLVALLLKARDVAILPTSLFIWLKPTNRTLFYALNQLGQRTSWVEGAGPLAHYQEEREQKKSLTEPMVDEAIEAFTYFLSRTGYLPPRPRKKSKTLLEYEKIMAQKKEKKPANNRDGCRDIGPNSEGEELDAAEYERREKLKSRRDYEDEEEPDFFGPKGPFGNDYGLNNMDNFPFGDDFSLKDYSNPEEGPNYEEPISIGQSQAREIDGQRARPNDNESNELNLRYGERNLSENAKNDFNQEDFDQTDFDQANFNRDHFNHDHFNQDEIDLTDFNHSDIDQTGLELTDFNQAEIDLTETDQTEIEGAGINQTEIDLTEIELTEIDLNESSQNESGKKGQGRANNSLSKTFDIDPWKY
ncbi:MAG: hypothetical protein LBI10_09190 [Deltaproteobacteria bacterium]|jgi:intracellular multiplication protein IcmP|nr:hypothetical protein [Deltaproteobacteria bacterium]